MMKKEISEVFNTDKFRDAGHKLVDLLADYLDQAKTGEDIPVLNWKDPEQQVKFWKDYKLEGDDLTPFFADVLNNSIHLHHPKYMGHQVAPPAPVSALADFLGAILNNGMVGYEMGSVTAAMENLVIQCFTEALGYGSEGDGFLTSGGTLANLTALLSARKAIVSRNIWEEGSGGEQLAVMVSSQAHYCIDRAARIMGLGAEGILTIEVNADFQINVELLEESWQEANEKGLHVFAIIGSAC